MAKDKSNTCVQCACEIKNTSIAAKMVFAKFFYGEAQTWGSSCAPGTRWDGDYMCPVAVTVLWPSHWPSCGRHRLWPSLSNPTWSNTIFTAYIKLCKVSF